MSLSLNDDSGIVTFTHTDARWAYVLPPALAAFTFVVLAFYSSSPINRFAFALLAVVSAGLWVAAQRTKRTWTLLGKRIVTPRGDIELTGVTALRVLVDDQTDIALDFADQRATVLIAAPYDRRGQRALVAALEAATGVTAKWPHPSAARG